MTYIYEVILIIGLTIIIYVIINIYLKDKKASRIINSLGQSRRIFSDCINLPSFLNTYIFKIKSQLINLDYPYKLTLINYLVIKYILSLVCFSISIINKNNFIISIIILILVFYLPNLLIKIFKNNEKVIIINELKNLTNAIIISLSASLTLEQAIKSSIKVINYSRLKKDFEKFATDYRISNYNIKKAISYLKKRYSYYEMELFASSLINSEIDGNMIKSLEKYNLVLDISYSKYLAKENSKRLIYLTLGTVIALINIIIIVMYPIFIEVSSNLQMIFK